MLAGCGMIQTKTMKPKPFPLSLVTTLLACLIVFFPAPLLACSCLPSNPESQFAQADAVFRGRVKKESKRGESVEYTLQVFESWKGKIPKKVKVSTASEDAACGYSFLKDQEYLVFANFQDGRKFSTGLCHGNKFWTEVSSEEQALYDGLKSKSPLKHRRV